MVSVLVPLRTCWTSRHTVPGQGCEQLVEWTQGPEGMIEDAQ